MKYLKDITDWKELKNEVACGDRLEGMKLIPDKSIDLVLTDPPYGIGISGQVGGSKLAAVTKYKEKDWDNEIPSRKIFNEMFRISKNQIIFGGNYFIEQGLTNSSCWIVWDKNNSGNFADCELAWTSFNSSVRLFKYTWNGMIQENMKQKDIRVHPTQKPVELMRWILANYTEEGQLICDPFMGSWTTARACKDLGRDFIGFELEEDYCKIGEKRLRQQVLF